MTDQANNLRNLILNRKKKDEVPPLVAEEPPKLTSRVITVSSGKGGVGKSNFSLNLAIELSKLNQRVVIIDADFGLANVEVLFGAVPKHTLFDVINGKMAINDILLDGPLDIKVLSGGSGFSELTNINESQISFLIEKFNYLDEISDIILIDTGAGISKQVIDFIKASKEAIIITTPEPTSITDAYAVIKTTKEQCKKPEDLPELYILVNRVDSKNEGDEIYEKISRVCEKFLSIKVNSLGHLPFDTNLVKAVKQQKPVCILYPNAPVAKNIERIGFQLLNKEVPENNTGFKSFIGRLAGIFANKS